MTDRKIIPPGNYNATVDDMTALVTPYRGTPYWYVRYALDDGRIIGDCLFPWHDYTNMNIGDRVSIIVDVVQAAMLDDSKMPVQYNRTKLRTEWTCPLC